jgi:hypothetical protein
MERQGSSPPPTPRRDPDPACQGYWYRGKSGWNAAKAKLYVPLHNYQKGTCESKHAKHWLARYTSQAPPPAPGPALTPGSIIGLWNEKSRRFVRMHPRGYMDRSAVRYAGTLKKSWQWEKFRVVDAGHGEYALWSPAHKRFIRMPGKKDTLDWSPRRPDGRLPKTWRWERFKVPGACPPRRAAGGQLTCVMG